MEDLLVCVWGGGMQEKRSEDGRVGAHVPGLIIGHPISWCSPPTSCRVVVAGNSSCDSIPVNSKLFLECQSRPLDVATDRLPVCLSKQEQKDQFLRLSE